MHSIARFPTRGQTARDRRYQLSHSAEGNFARSSVRKLATPISVTYCTTGGRLAVQNQSSKERAPGSLGIADLV